MFDKIVRGLLNGIQIIILILIIIVFIFQSFFSSIIILDTKSILIILVGTICIHILNSYLTKNEIIKHIDFKKNIGLKIEANVNDVYDDIFNQTKHIKHLKIYTDTSSIMQSHFFAEQELCIEECTLLLRVPKYNNSFYNEKYINEITSTINRWKMMAESGKIKKITIIKYDTLSDIYYIAIDEKLLVTDLQYIDMNSITFQSTNHSPILISNETNEGKIFIKRCLKQIDNYIAFYGSNSDNIVYKNF